MRNRNYNEALMKLNKWCSNNVNQSQHDMIVKYAVYLAHSMADDLRNDVEHFISTQRDREFYEVTKSEM